MKPPKNDVLWLFITPIFYSRILFYYQNEGVCKKLDLNILKIEWALVILSLKKKIWNFFKHFEKIFSLRKIAIIWPIFRISSKKMFYLITDEPLLLNIGQQLFHMSKKRSKLAEKSFGVLKTHLSRNRWSETPSLIGLRCFSKMLKILVYDCPEQLSKMDYHIYV